MENLELLKQTPIQMNFPFQWNRMGEPNGPVVIRMGALEWIIQKHLFPSFLIQDTKKPFQQLTFQMDHLNEKTELLKQTHILKDHLNGKTELLKQTHIQMDFPFQQNGMVETNGARFSLIGKLKRES